MGYKSYLKHFSSNRDKYLLYLYPLLIPFVGFFSSTEKVPGYGFQGVLKYWLSIFVLTTILLVLIKKIIYLTAYKQPIRWLMAFCVAGLVVCLHSLLENNFLHLMAVVHNPNEWYAPMRNMNSAVLLIALFESIKTVAERKKILIDNKMLENENAQAQLNLLLQQINPHFLFNCLTVSQAMARSKDERTEEFIIKLEEVYRQTLKKDRGTVTLQEELDFFNAYMYLMGLRQENAIFADIQVSEEALGYHLPVFSLQLLAENCIKHNIVSASKPLTIRLYQKDAKSLTIENNIQPKNKKSESFGIGIQNLKKRYALEGIVRGVQIEQNEISYATTIKLF